MARFATLRRVLANLRDGLPAEAVRTDAPVRTCWSSSLMTLTCAGPSGRRCREIHWSRSAPSSGTVRTRKRTSSTSSVRLTWSSRSAKPRPNRLRSSASLIPVPGCTIAAVAAQVRVAWF